VRSCVWIFVVVLGCRPKPPPDEMVDINVDAGAPPEDADADSDADADADADADTDVDTDEGTDEDDTGPEPESFPCNAEPTETMIDECVTKELRCDMDPMMSTTKGAISRYDGDMYIAWQCFPFGDGPYDGPDRVYAFTHPGDGSVQINLHTPCGELDLFAIQWTGWEEDDECPTDEHAHRLRCDDKTEEGDDTITLFENSEMEYLIIVDGPEATEENFTLEAICP